MMVIDRIKLENGWEIQLVEAFLPERPRHWRLVKNGYPDLVFPKTSMGFPGIEMCKAVSSYIEKHVKRGCLE